MSQLRANAGSERLWRQAALKWYGTSCLRAPGLRESGMQTITVTLRCDAREHCVIIIQFSRLLHAHAACIMEPSSWRDRHASQAHTYCCSKNLLGSKTQLHTSLALTYDQCPQRLNLKLRYTVLHAIRSQRLPLPDACCCLPNLLAKSWNFACMS
jgi:hypothetical protein